jgi:glycerol-3-phosphate cytidylyltransferase-like family protein
MNSKKKYSLIQLDSEVSYDHSIREARPIGEILAMMEPSENISAILTGAGVNDEDDNVETMNSIRAAEKAVGGSMKAPSVDTSLYQKTGTKF